jgi:hypothetical protein
MWNHEVEVDDIVPGDEMVFTVMDQDLGKDELLGTVTVPSSMFCPGFDGELTLKDAGKDGAALHVRIQPSRSTRDQALEPWAWVAVRAAGHGGVLAEDPMDCHGEWFPSYLVRSRPKPDQVLQVFDLAEDTDARVSRDHMVSV